MTEKAENINYLSSSSSDNEDDFDSDENSETRTWMKLIRRITADQLEILRNNFADKNDSMNKAEFVAAIGAIFGEAKYTNQAILVFNEASTFDLLNWMDFLNFMLTNLHHPSSTKIFLNSPKILTVPHIKKETIVKIVLIETEKYFCYAMLSKHGKVGLYDGNLNFLTTYNIIMTREDINRKEEERRRRNRWVTDAIFCPDILMFIVTNSARSVVIYEASGLKHVALYLILSTPNIVECFAYKMVNEKNECTLFMGDSKGVVFSFNFIQTKIGLLRKKHNDKINLFYWDELPNEKDFILIKTHGKFHKNGVNHLKYCHDNEVLISSSKDSDISIVKRNINKTYIFKMPKGVNSFDLSRYLKMLITGSPDGILRLWNPIITIKPIAILKGHSSSIIDVKIFDKQELFLSCSSDGMLKLWDIKEHQCLQTLVINFPSFTIFGKLIEWGIESIYPGPKRLQNNNNNILERSNILVSCCNHIAVIKLNFDNKEIEKNFEMQVLPPPPLQNSVLVPQTWHTCDKITRNFSVNSNSKIEEVDEEIVEKRLEELKFILDRDLFGGNCLRSDINLKIANLEKKKLEMKSNVERGAPYLALDLYEISEIKLSPNLPVPNRKKIKNLAAKVEKILTDATEKDLIFSEPSSSRSPKSSRSSIVEFEY